MHALECHLQEISYPTVQIPNAVLNASSHHTYSDPKIHVSLGHDIVTKEIELEIQKFIGNTFVIMCLSHKIRYSSFCLYETGALFIKVY